MKKFLPILLFLLVGCAQSPQEKIAKIEAFEYAIFDEDSSLNFSEKDYLVFSSTSGELKGEEIIQRRDKLYIKLMTEFLDPDVKVGIKNKIILFFQNLDTPPINASININDWGIKEYLSLRPILFDSFFDIETRILFYKQLASLKELSMGLDDEVYLKNQLCAAVSKNQLGYASLLIDFSIDMFDPGRIRCIKGKPSYNMILFSGNTVGMMSDQDVKSKLNVCPMSLRRISGRNAGQAISARISAWQYDVQQIDRDSIKSLDDAKDKIKRTFSNAPSLNPIPGNMNALLDKYDNTWKPGGDCSLESNARFH